MIYTTKNKKWSYYILEIDEYGGFIHVTDHKRLKTDRIMFECIKKGDKLLSGVFAEYDEINLITDFKLPNYLINELKELIKSNKN